MNRRSHFVAIVLSFWCCTLLSYGQTASTAPSKHSSASLEQQLIELRQQMKEQNAALQTEIDLLKAQLGKKTAAQDTGVQTAKAAEQKAASAEAQAAATAQQNADVMSEVHATMAQNASTTGAIAQVQETQAKLKQQIESPASLHYKGVTLTPGGYVAGESIWRQRAMDADVYTNFNSTPYPGAGQAHTSEWVPSARQSRMSMLATGKVPFGTLKGYFEGDFHSAGSTSNNLQSNSYTLRIRQAWGQFETGRFTFTGGQMWTLLAENKQGVTPGQEAFPLIFDANLHVGFTYIRQMGFRFQEAIKPGVNLAIALENSQYQFSATNAPSNFFFGGAGASGGLNNPLANYTNQVAPDILAKVTFDPGYGHYEIGGVARFFRDRYYPSAPSPAGAKNDTKLGGGFVASAKFPVTSKVDLGLHLVAGDGTGRYGASLLPDITVKPDGTLEPLRNLQGLFSLEVHATKKLDLFGYAGTEYAQRTFYRSANGTLVGYAPPSADNTGCFTEAAPTNGTGYAPGSGTCSGATRAITEGSLGYIYRIYSGPAGKLQYGLAYSYLTKSGWYGAGGAPKATNNFVYTSFRYYLP